MASEQLNLEWVIKVVNDAKAGIDSAISDYKRLNSAAAGAGKAGETIGGTQQQQRMSGLHTRITQLTTGFRKLGIELETIDLYFISGFKVLGLFKILEFAKQSILSFENYRKSLLGVQLAAELSGQTIETAMSSLNNLLKMGKLGAEDLAEAMRNLLKKGYNASEAEKIIKILTMSGTVFGTQANMPLGEAVKRSTEGLLQELSRLVDATRLTKNLDQMWKDYAKTINKTVDSLGEHEKRQAVVAYFLQESIGLTEKYEQANTGLTRSLGGFSIAFDKLKRETGEGLAAPATKAIDAITKSINGLIKSTDILGSSIQFINTILTSSTDIGLGTILAFFKELFKSGNIFTQQFTFDPINKAIITAYETAKGKIHQLSYELDDFYAKHFGRSSVFYNIFGMGKATIEINPVISREKIQAFNGTDIFNQNLTGEMWWNKKDTSTVDFGKMIDVKKLEDARKMGEKIATAFSYPLERGISDVFFNLFTGEKSSFIEMARSFGRSLARAISDAMAEAMVSSIKPWFSALFSGVVTGAGAGIGGAAGGGGGGGTTLSSPGGGFGTASTKAITVNVGSGLTPREIGNAVEAELNDSYSRNSKIRKVIKAQR
mgnify:FL=1